MHNGISIIAIAGGLGLIFGSLLNVVVYRLPRMLERRWRQECAEYMGQEVTTEDNEAPYNLFVPRSACPACQRMIRSWENIPILSYIMLRGRCAGCGARISLRYPAIELLTGILSAVMVWRFGWSFASLGGLIFTWILIAAAAIDLEHYLLPDALTLPLLWIGLLFNTWNTFVPLKEAVIGAAAGYLVLWLIFHIFRLLTGKEGMGRGDFKLLACLGAWTGWRMLPLTVLAAAAIGAIVGGSWLLFSKRGREHPIPFGPFLAAAGLLALTAGPAIVHTYMHWALPARH